MKINETIYRQQYRSGKITYLAICEKQGSEIKTQLHSGGVSSTPVLERSYPSKKSLSLCAEAIWSDFRNQVKKALSQRAFNQLNNED